MSSHYRCATKVVFFSMAHQRKQLVVGDGGIKTTTIKIIKTFRRGGKLMKIVWHCVLSAMWNWRKLFRAMKAAEMCTHCCVSMDSKLQKGNAKQILCYTIIIKHSTTSRQTFCNTPSSLVHHSSISQGPRSWHKVLDMPENRNLSSSTEVVDLKFLITSRCSVSASRDLVQFSPPLPSFIFQLFSLFFFGGNEIKKKLSRVSDGIRKIFVPPL